VRYDEAAALRCGHVVAQQMSAFHLLDDLVQEARIALALGENPWVAAKLFVAGESRQRGLVVGHALSKLGKTSFRHYDCRVCRRVIRYDGEVAWRCENCQQTRKGQGSLCGCGQPNSRAQKHPPWGPVCSPCAHYLCGISTRFRSHMNAACNRADAASLVRFSCLECEKTVVIQREQIGNRRPVCLSCTKKLWWQRKSQSA